MKDALDDVGRGLVAASGDGCSGKCLCWTTSEDSPVDDAQDSAHVEGGGRDGWVADGVFGLEEKFKKCGGSWGLHLGEFNVGDSST